ncbi:hypothetical protein AALB52_12010 [Lachnospiraceae bacterium 38-14]|jgi:hypothetical protein|uniref:hypothetical protein n=1 Tax=Roseburia sp. 1XD42-69 TaxID=2320088 RepID=UPI000EA1FA96|nr:hypothetical protein [Roseburia sp. 1XD42-69]MCX4319393.1 hypothetical protein [Lachnospiraceae bacterium]MDE6906019.1 hypothetical protein [Lachnospiraceae bacterium]MDE6981273.1 hypothetical protein [Lachnospiraceae bacterium]RKJ65157.1 hypothetical protein D7Y06_10380 [Roseburia sp. 1XD42-69]
MGFRVTIDGSGPVNLTEQCVTSVEFFSDIPKDSNARATDNGTALKIRGKLLFSLGAEAQDATINMAKWSVVPSESADAYRNVKVDVVAAGQIVRQFTLPNAFVMEYEEELDDETGVGAFYLHVKQKKDLTKMTKIEGGFSE